MLQLGARSHPLDPLERSAANHLKSADTLKALPGRSHEGKVIGGYEAPSYNEPEPLQKRVSLPSSIRSGSRASRFEIGYDVGCTGATLTWAVVGLLRGDYEMCEANLLSAHGGRETLPMSEEESEAPCHSSAGFPG